METRTTAPLPPHHPGTSTGVYRWISWGFLLIGLYFVLTLILIIIRGGEWDVLITVNNPKKRMLAAMLACAGWVFTYKGTAPWQDFKTKAGRLLLMGISIGIVVAGAEPALRLALSRNQGHNSLAQLASQRSKTHLYTQSFHPLAAIVTLSSNPRLVYELQPDLNMEFGHRTLKTNRDGLRASRDFTIPKPPDTLRILGIGDSGMFGWNVHQGEDYLSVLQSLLPPKGPPHYEVLNLAIPGYNSFQEVERLRARGLAYAPDIVIVGWCDNDVDLPFFLTQPVNYARRDVSFLYHLLFNREQFRLLVAPPACKASEIDPQLVDPAILDSVGSDGVTRALQDLQELSIQHNFKVLVFGPMREQIKSICDHLGLAYFNTYAEIPADKYPSSFGVHFMHPSAEGHRALAGELLAVLRRNGWLDTP